MAGTRNEGLGDGETDCWKTGEVSDSGLIMEASSDSAFCWRPLDATRPTTTATTIARARAIKTTKIIFRLGLLFELLLGTCVGCDCFLSVTDSLFTASFPLHEAWSSAALMVSSSSRSVVHLRAHVVDSVPASLLFEALGILLSSRSLPVSAVPPFASELPTRPVSELADRLGEPLTSTLSNNSSAAALNAWPGVCCGESARPREWRYCWTS